MLTKFGYLIFSIIFALSIQGHALTKFPKGTCHLDGLLVKATNEPNWYFIVNPRTNAETRFRLKPFSLTGMSPSGQYVQAVLEVSNETFSLYGDAELVKVDHFLNPYNDVTIYNGPSDVEKACLQSRNPNSVINSKKKKSP